MSELFEIPETLSPRLEWMRKHGIEVMDDAFDAFEGRDRWIAFLGPDPGVNEYGETKDEALARLAARLEIKLWNE